MLNYVTTLLILLALAALLLWPAAKFVSELAIKPPEEVRSILFGWWSIGFLQSRRAIVTIPILAASSYVTLAYEGHIAQGNIVKVDFAYFGSNTQNQNFITPVSS